MKKYLLFDHDGVLVDTEFWYYKATERALADVGLTLDKDQYLRDMNQGLGTWAQAGRQVLTSRPFPGSARRATAIVTTAKRAGFELIHEKRSIRRFMDFVLVREDYQRAKSHPEPYLTGLRRFGADREETLVVEDSPRWLKSAVAVGLECAIVRSDFTHAPDFPGASYRIEALIELRDIITGQAPAGQRVQC